jgi:hypothetical protein
MGIFNEDEEDDEIEEIASDIIELYNDITNGNFEELKSSSTAYLREYKKIIQNLKDHFNSNILGGGPPDFLYQLEQELHNGGWPLKDSTTIKTIEMGLKKIMKKFNIEIPGKSKIEENKLANYPQVQNILYANQSMDNQINISIELRVEIDKAINQFIEELNKSKPDPSKLKKLWEIIKKGAGYGTIKVIEELLKKVFGI